MEREEQVMKKVTLSIDEKLLEQFDDARISAGYATRSAAIAEAVRRLIEKIKRKR